MELECRRWFNGAGWRPTENRRICGELLLNGFALLTLHRLPSFLRVLYVGIAVFWVLALASHWLRLSLRHGAQPGQVKEWYLGNENDEEASVMLFERSWLEVAEDAWGNLFHHTLALLVMAGLLVRTDAGARTRGVLAAGILLSLPLTAAGPPLIRWGVPAAAHAYIFGLGLLNLSAVAIASLVFRDAMLRKGKGPRGTMGGSVAGGLMFLILAGSPSLANAQDATRQLMSVDEARALAFPSASRFVTDTLRVDAALRTQLEETLGRSIFDMQFLVDRVFDGQNEFLGYSMVTDEHGKYRPITMMVSASPDQQVARVSILIYRESRGGEVARERFLRQYRGRGHDDPIRINRDVVNVSGATISVISVNHGVKKTLALIERIYQ
jgi:hypothetical protein